MHLDVGGHCHPPLCPQVDCILTPFIRASHTYAPVLPFILGQEYHYKTAPVSRKGSEPLSSFLFLLSRMVIAHDGVASQIRNLSTASWPLGPSLFDLFCPRGMIYRSIHLFSLDVVELSSWEGQGLLYVQGEARGVRFFHCNTLHSRASYSQHTSEYS